MRRDEKLRVQPTLFSGARRPSRHSALPSSSRKPTKISSTISHSWNISLKRKM